MSSKKSLCHELLQPFSCRTSGHATFTRSQVLAQCQKPVIVEQLSTQVTPEERRTTTSVHVFPDAGVEDEDLQRKLKTFGTVVGPITLKYDLYKGHRIDAGVRYVIMILKEVVPSFDEIEMSGGGKATCRICKKEGHIAILVRQMEELTQITKKQSWEGRLMTVWLDIEAWD